MTTRRKPQKPLCTECGKPVTCGQGTRHLGCSPLCGECFSPIPSPGSHKCQQKRSGGES